MYGSRAVTPLVIISDDVINRILKLDIQTNILVYVTRCCTDLTSKVLKERTFGQSSAVLLAIYFFSSILQLLMEPMFRNNSNQGFLGEGLCDESIYYYWHHKEEALVEFSTEQAVMLRWCIKTYELNMYVLSSVLNHRTKSVFSFICR